ncbi:hypothetical protein Com2_45 [Cutibacterium phage CaCom2]|uniref:Uncharacterized protein n=1 Tax=Siphoviridae sp. ctj7f2 TaxID=2823593 RepID=A0A8S5L8L9_9CAUD|nr:hypothetical protein Com2_45 [Cutibacterium phage CaCom2]DAD66283.1 MAG TPA: hypothetical protein [Siphoviridae sp. ctj7f2]
MDLYYQKHPFTPLKPAYRAKTTSLTHPRWGMIGWTGSQLDARPKSADAAFTLTSISLPNTLKLQG